MISKAVHVQILTKKIVLTIILMKVKFKLQLLYSTYVWQLLVTSVGES